jgi:hypothetical protein
MQQPCDGPGRLWDGVAKNTDFEINPFQLIAFDNL